MEYPAATSAPTSRTLWLALAVAVEVLIAAIDFAQKSVSFMPLSWTLIIIAAIFVTWRQTLILSALALLLSLGTRGHWGHFDDNEYEVQFLTMVSLSIVAAVLANHITRKNDRLVRLSVTDALTGLPNRILLIDRMVQHSRRRGAGPNAIVAYVDLVDFKTVNDTYGHAAGDEILKQVAVRLHSIARRGDTVARIGGDEFVLVTTPDSAPPQPQALVDRINAALLPAIHIGQVVIHQSAAIGISVGEIDDHDPAHLIKLADQELIRLKTTARDPSTTAGPVANKFVTTAAQEPLATQA